MQLDKMLYFMNIDIHDFLCTTPDEKPTDERILLCLIAGSNMKDEIREQKLFCFTTISQMKGWLKTMFYNILFLVFFTFH